MHENVFIQLSSNKVLCTVPVAYWLRHPLREREVEGSNASWCTTGDEAGW